ncbi:hypothetical protein FHN55_10815 [Streptomyces sp. NP160]|uniref:hypothetical protein n=1 Tax=Streptomyces sp. NP160 TaxID=2586637 RepID=UPI0011191EA6|nr:hypothetical protein [Streptomyces sp. NP160]TNM67366.1 hypothetical protein FHN55_10815 [Streptomyces sp. NP160]
MIGWYVHHHGVGHLQRLVAVTQHLRTPVTAFSSAARPAGFAGEWVQLDRDDDEPVDRSSATAGGALHWVPLHHAGLRSRSAAVVEWVARERPRLFVTDVSVEMTALVRLCGVPVVVAAMLGDRHDPAHRLGRAVAQALLAPWPAPRRSAQDDDGAPVLHVGAFSRFDGRDAPAAASEPGRVLVLWGSGGRDVTDADLLAAAEAAPGWRWEHRVPGSALSAPVGEGSRDGDGVWEALLRAEVVVVHGGHNAVAEVAAARRAAVVVAQERPFGEQVRRAELLRAEGLVALDAWPRAHEWPELLERARAVGAGPWERWAPGDGAQRAARHLDALAAAGGRLA